ncbi:hypothetical protein KIW84_030015 [Lathyrus oleraceus]|uniref:Malectin domain-containing protein n=1 Tax=Pisum sativum TaxID=3888 RepID=A0A9D4XP97_PEA|nr:hypothetical protein KIW84_030015 [Pisum sativum]
MTRLRYLQIIDLSHNYLNVPPIWRKNAYVDLSCNNLSINRGSQICHDRVNLFSTSWTRNDIEAVSCLSLKCTKPSYSLYINCGGNQAIVNGKSYDGDSDSAGPARFRASSTGNWAFSTTGVFMENHETYGSLGRRVFDIYIQGKQMQKDFNIAQEAGGVGTQAVPNKSVYGPLISAISVESDSPPGRISTGAIVGIVVAATIIMILVFGILWWKGCFGKKNSLARGVLGIFDQGQTVFPQQSNPSEVPSTNSQSVNNAYDGRERFAHNSSKLSDVQPLLQSSGFTPPLYATAAAYMTSINPYYTNMQASGTYAPQYVGGYTLNPTAFILLHQLVPSQVNHVA